MLLKRLEISGFKSFAKPTVLEFPTKITAIVGPNGSGKSNIADSIRWVLGEQALRYLRGKKGEDLIFGGGGGAQKVARMGKASVDMVFDNKIKNFPLEFDEVIIGRRVYRDSVNEYTLNGSQVRLKDTVELLSKVGLGASQHHIIAQGDADRILYASPKERKSMIEEALGLKIFELKKNEAERKLASTEENIKQVESLRREIQPHLKYLNLQAGKMKNAAELRKELDALSGEYVSRELKTLTYELAETEKNKAPVEKKIAELERDIKNSESALDKNNGAEQFFKAQRELDEKKEVIAKQKIELGREIGRMEGESKHEASSPADMVPKTRIKVFLMEILPDLEKISRFGTMEAVRNTIFELTQNIYRFLELLNGGRGHSQKDFTAAVKNIKEELVGLDEQENDILKNKAELQKKYEEKAIELQKAGVFYRQKDGDLAKSRDALRAILSKEERVLSLKKEFEIDFGYLIKMSAAQGDLLDETERTQFKKKIERLRIRLEEAGGVDEEALKEFEDTKKRDEFLGKELEDLKNAAASLKEAFENLEARITKDFENGLFKINELFGKFFHEIFGGGTAEIKFFKPIKRKTEAEVEETEWEGEAVEEETGLDIIVDIPRKRIRSLSMLSGGERALSSIALLFAMSTANPPPFLVLDETDAALDEANSNRYAAMLKELGKKTQLIVVTHNRETMRAADVLYGVTMGGDGISKLLSIKFEEAEDVLKK